MTVAKEMNPMMAAVCAVLQKNKNADFQTVKAKVARHGELYPIVYGRAKALLGLVPTKPRKDRVAPADGAPVKRGPGRPRKTPQDAVAAAHERRARAAKGPVAASNGSLELATGDDAFLRNVADVVRRKNELARGLMEVRGKIDDLLNAN